MTKKSVSSGVTSDMNVVLEQLRVLSQNLDLIQQWAERLKESAENDE